MGFSALIVPLELVEKEGISKDEFWCYVEELHARRIQNLNQELRSVERVFCKTLEWLNITHRAENIFREVVSFFETQHDPDLLTPTSSDTYVVLCSIVATDTHFVAPRPRAPVAVFLHREEPTGASLFNLGQKSQFYAQQEYNLSLSSQGGRASRLNRNIRYVASILDQSFTS